MVYDFSKICKTYEAKTYTRSDFAATRCPKCPAVGRFNLHGSYWRHVLYFTKRELKHEYIEIKRIMCISCETTHAVMPGDIVPYKLLSLIVILLILNLIYAGKEPVLKIAAAWRFSFQFIYFILAVFLKHKSGIYNFLREASHGVILSELDSAGIVALVRRPYTQFQSDYIKLNKRPCFMCKFFNNANAPPVGLITPNMAAT